MTAYDARAELAATCPSCGAESGSPCVQWRPELGRWRQITSTHWARTHPELTDQKEGQR